MTSFRALYAGECVDCPTPIQPGDPITRVDGGGYRHVTCPDDPKFAEDRAALAHPRCPRCGTNHPGEC